MKEPPFLKARASLVYNDKSKEILLKLKHCDRLDLAKPLARLVYLKTIDILKAADAVIPVPLHRKRLWTRRYNQATLLARELTKLLKDKEEQITPVLTQILIRKKETAPQGSTLKSRYTNVHNAFRIKNNTQILGKSIVLIDDVYTTGATLKACARTLKRAGAKEIFVITAARVVRGQDL